MTGVYKKEKKKKPCPKTYSKLWKRITGSGVSIKRKTTNNDDDKKKKIKC